MLRDEEEGSYGEIKEVRVVLVGVVTGGVGCGTHAFPGIYATVAEDHLDWVRETMDGY